MRREKQMSEKTIKIDGRDVKFKATAAVPRMYRNKFKRDIFADFSKLTELNTDESIKIEDLEIFENVAFIMAFHADNTIGTDIDSWLEQFSMFSVYEVLPELLTLWADNLKTDVESKKNKIPPNAK